MQNRKITKVLQVTGQFMSKMHNFRQINWTTNLSVLGDLIAQCIHNTSYILLFTVFIKISINIRLPFLCIKAYFTKDVLTRFLVP
jgi:hypothetical protein